MTQHDPDLLVLAGAHGGVLSRADLGSLGLSDRDVRRLVGAGTLARVHRDAYRVPVPDEAPFQRYHAAVRTLGLRRPEHVLAGPAAVSALGLPLFGDPGTIHVVSDRRHAPSARSLMTMVHAPPPEQLINRGGVQIVGPARAVLDTARLQGLVAGVVAADAALRSGLTTRAELSEVLGSMHGLRGVGRARLCYELASPLSESPGESWSAVVMHQHGVPEPERQHRFFDDDGFAGRTDFWWPEWRVAGEFDGRVKYGRTNPSGRPPEDVLWDEKRREDRIRALDASVVRWITADLYQPSPWINRLRHLLKP